MPTATTMPRPSTEGTYMLRALLCESFVAVLAESEVVLCGRVCASPDAVVAALVLVVEA